jgi:hypothetical protein
VTVSIPHVVNSLSKSPYILDRSVQKNFVETVRAVELLLGIPIEGHPALQGAPNDADMSARLQNACKTDNSGLFDPESVVVKALTEAAFILPEIMFELEWLVDFGVSQGRAPLTTKFAFPPLSRAQSLTRAPFAASWTSSGSTMTRQTLRALPSALRHTTIIFTTG